MGTVVRHRVGATGVLVIAALLCGGAGALGAPVYIDFEDQPNGANVTNAYLPFGVQITTDAGSGSGHVRVLESASLAVSGTKWILPNPDVQGASYFFTFIDPLTGLDAVTDFFSITTDLASNSNERIQLRGFDLGGNPIHDSGLQVPTPAETFSISTAGLHVVQVYTFGDPGLGLDDLRFNAVTLPVPESGPAGLGLLALGALALSLRHRRV